MFPVTLIKQLNETEHKVLDVESPRPTTLFRQRKWAPHLRGPFPFLFLALSGYRRSAPGQRVDET
jgi:hypothetical protein